MCNFCLNLTPYEGKNHAKNKVKKCNSLYLQKIKINMSEISLKKVINDKMLTDFIQFPMTLYKNNPNYVPALINDEKQIWDPKRTL